MTKCAFSVGAMTALLILPLPAQRSASPLPPEDPRLYAVFLHFHDNVNSTIQSKKAQDPLGGDKAEKGFAQKLKIKQEDLAKVTDVAHAFVANLTSWQNDLKAYVDKVRTQNQQPDATVLQQFDQRKQQLIAAAIRQLSTTLPATSWAGLHSYINDEHRLHTSLIQVGAPRP